MNYDIVDDLRSLAVITFEVQGKAQLTMLSGDIFDEAADEIENLRMLYADSQKEIDRLREELKVAQSTALFWEREFHRG